MNLNSVIFLVFSIVSFSVYSHAAKSNVIKVATYLEPPIVDYVNGRYQGENIAVIKLLAKKLNKEIKFIQCPIARCLSMMREGDADLILSLKKTPVRQQYLSFVEPAFKVQRYPLRFFTLKERALSIDSFADLSPLVIGAIRGAAYFEKFDNNQTLNKVFVTEHMQLTQMLIKQRIDTFLEREETILALMEQQQYQNTFALANYQYDQAVYSYIAVSKRSPLHHDIKQISAQLIAMIKTGELATLVNNDKVPELPIAQ